MELLTKSGTYTPYEPDCESFAYLEVYRLSEDEMCEINGFVYIQLVDHNSMLIEVLKCNF